MKRFFIAAAALVLAAGAALAQTTPDEYAAKYGRLANAVGTDGVGIETYLGKWQAAFPDDPNMYTAWFNFWYKKSQNPKIVQKNQAKFMGNKPALSLKDSLGNDVNYFEEIMFDDEMFGKATKALDNAIKTDGKRLDLRTLKIQALTSYEKESPDMAEDMLISLIDYNYSTRPKWEYGTDMAEEGSFEACVQECCYSFFLIGSPRSLEAFREVSEKMLKYNPKSVLFLDDMGSWYLVAKDDTKTAMKYFNKALKVDKNDITALKNCVIIARKKGDRKAISKYQIRLSEASLPH